MHGIADSILGIQGSTLSPGKSTEARNLSRSRNTVLGKPASSTAVARMAAFGAQAPSDKQQGTPSTCQRAPANTGNGRDRERIQHQPAGGFCRQGQPALPSRHVLYSDRSKRRTNRGREAMRDDPRTAANRDKEGQKVTIPPRRKATAETRSPPPKPTISGPFWTGQKNSTGCPTAARDRRRATTNR
jgi:hypothetical protein